MLQDESDRRRLQDLGTRCFGGCDPNIDALAHELGPQGRALLALVTNRDAARVPPLIAALPEPVQEQLGRRALATRDLPPPAGRLILVPGRRATLMPPRARKAPLPAPPGGRP